MVETNHFGGFSLQANLYLRSLVCKPKLKPLRSLWVRTFSQYRLSTDCWLIDWLIDLFILAKLIFPQPHSHVYLTRLVNISLSLWSRRTQDKIDGTLFPVELWKDNRRNVGWIEFQTKRRPTFSWWSSLDCHVLFVKELWLTGCSIFFFFIIGERGQRSGKNSRREYFSFEPKCSYGNSLYNHLELHSQHMFSFLFSTFTPSASVSRFTNTVISGPPRVRNTGTVLPQGLWHGCS